MSNYDAKKIIRDIDRRTLMQINSSFHFEANQGSEFTRMFDEYKNQIVEFESKVKTGDKAWLLLEEIMSHPDFIIEESILTKAEHSRRIGSMNKIIEKYM